MNNKESASSSERATGGGEPPTEGTSWLNPGEFPSFNGKNLTSEMTAEIKRIDREKARSEAERQYREELSRPYEDGAEQAGVTKFPIDFDGKEIDCYEFMGAEFKMLVSVIGAVGQSLGNQPRDVDLDKWIGSSRDYISTSLISDKKMNLFDKEGLVFGFNNLKEGDFLSAAPADHGVLRDIGKMGQYKDCVMNPSELLEATGTRESLTPWNEVELNGDTKPDSIIIFGNSRNDISNMAKKAALFFEIPIYLIRTDIYGEPTDRHDSREVTDDVEKFWENRDNPVSGRIEQERSALLEEVEVYFKTGKLGERVTKYLGDYESELEAARESSSNTDEFTKNLIAMLGQEKMAALKEQIEDGD